MQHTLHCEITEELGYFSSGRVSVTCHPSSTDSLAILVDDLSVILRLYFLPALTKLKIVDHIKPVVGLVLRVDFLVKLFSHVLFESSMVTKCALTIQTLQAEVGGERAIFMQQDWHKRTNKHCGYYSHIGWSLEVIYTIAVVFSYI